jgi:peptidoglycan hydrolase-like protein with peptidoglycan-binding domain
VSLNLRRACLAPLLAVAVMGSLIAPATAASPPVSLPAKPSGLKAPVRLPAAIDDYSGYQPQASCSPVVLPGVAKLRNLVLRTYQRGHDGGVTRSCVSGGSSEHKEGRAWDWMVNVSNRAERRAAADFLSWLTARGPDGRAGHQARRLGIMYVIYNRRIWSAYRSGDGWRYYSGYSPHTDHVHVSFSWAGARGMTSFWRGRVTGSDYGRCSVFRGQPGVLTAKARRTPCESTVPLVRRSRRAIQLFGSHNTNAMRLAQSRLGVRRTGTFDRRTWRAVKRYQNNHDLPRTGAIDHPTWTSLVPRTTRWRANTGYGWRKAGRYGNRHFSGTVRRRGDAGKSIFFLQTALRMHPRDRNGFFGPKTASAVRRYKRQNDFDNTGAAVGKFVWQHMARR